MQLVYIALAWSGGIALARAVPELSPMFWLIACAVIGGVAVLALRDRVARRVALVLLAFGLGALRLSLYPTTSDLAGANRTGGMTIEGVVVAPPDVRDARQLLTVEAEYLIRGGEVFRTDGRALVYAARYTDVRYGDRVRATGTLHTPPTFDTFSYSEFLARSGVFSLMRNASVEVVSRGHGDPFYASLLDLRNQADDLIGRHLPEPHASLLSGILLGKERGISPQVADAFSVSGAAHVIAISGFNMVIISGVVMRLLNALTPRRWLSAFVGIAVIAVYTLFVGAGAAVVRAALMSSLLVIAEALRRRTYVPASLAFVTLLMSLHNPTVLWDVGFQLSVAAVLGLALFTDPLSVRFNHLLERLLPVRWARSVSAFLSEPLIVTLASLTLTLPLSMLYFQRFSFVIVPVNLLIVPVQSLVLFSGALAVIAAFLIPFAAQALFWVCMVFLGWTISVVRFFASLPGADVEANLDGRLVGVFFVAVIGWGIMRAVQPDWWYATGRFVQRRIVWLAALLSATVFAALGVGAIVSQPDGRLHVWFLDVGHNNAVLIQSPEGAHILIDGGRYPSRLLTALGDRLPFYDRELEAVFVTQPDEDQMGALPAVLRRYTASAVLGNGQPNLSLAYRTFTDALGDRPLQTVTAGYTVRLDDGVRIEVLHPASPPPLGEPFGNGTLVLRVVYGEVSFLITSQLNERGQNALLESGVPPATVLQVPRHGTVRALNPDLLAAVQPSAVVIQADVGNFRADPDYDLVALLDGYPLYRTDEMGAVHFWTDGRELWVAGER